MGQNSHTENDCFKLQLLKVFLQAFVSQSELRVSQDCMESSKNLLFHMTVPAKWACWRGIHCDLKCDDVLYLSVKAATLFTRVCVNVLICTFDSVVLNFCCYPLFQIFFKICNYVHKTTANNFSKTLCEYVMLLNTEIVRIFLLISTFFGHMKRGK